MIFWKKTSPLNLIIWHVLKFSIQILTKIQNFCSKVTCFNILDQNLTCLEKLVSNCEASGKIWMKICSFFQKIIRIKIREASWKCQLSRFHGVRWPKENDFLRAFFSLVFEFPQKNFFQNLKHCKNLDFYSDGWYEG